MEAVSDFRGLTGKEAAARLRAEGPNELPSPTRRHFFEIAWELVREPMILLLVACGTIYVFLGEPREALFLWASIGVIVGIEIYQQQKTERALEALRELSAPQALVIRDGRRVRIPGREVVRGDAMVLLEGDRVPADGVLRGGDHLVVDESLLTGESAAVRKAPDARIRETGRPGGENLHGVFAGTLVIGGEGVAQALATGLRAEMGKIGKSLQTLEPEQTHIQRETARLVRILAAFGAVLCTAVAVLYALSRGSWLQGFLAGITLAISLLPEELPVVLTIFLALGAWKLSRQQVLTRRVPAVEMLGAATVLCSDKTGTLTLNQMSVRETAAASEKELAVTGALASRREPFDPTEKAIHAFAVRLDSEFSPQKRTLVREYPFSRDLPAVAYAWSGPGFVHVAAKGAPEAVLRLCGLDAARSAQAEQAVHAMASKALRVLAVAQARLSEAVLPSRLTEIPFEWVGLIGLSDPLRPAVPQAIRECREAGVRVVMITGDYPATARQIAREAGLGDDGEVLTGPEIDRMDDARLKDKMRSVDVFARIVPEQKLRLVEALKADGQIVAMTGDGVNDAPALKAAHIGIAMAGRGTDVAREAAALMLLDDDFTSIVRGIRMGRRVFDNLQKAMAYIFAIHVPIAGMSLVPLLLGGPLVLLPVHIVFMELVIDPACSIAFEAEPEETDVMKRPPRRPYAPLFGRRTVGISLLEGAGTLAAVLAVFALTLWRGANEEQTRAMAFTTLILGNLALILTNRSWSRKLGATLRTPNRAFWYVIGGASAMLAVVLGVPYFRELFRFAALGPGDLAVCAAAAGLTLVWFEFLKSTSKR